MIVGVSFNPSGDPDVHKIKMLYAQIIDTLHNLKFEVNCSENKRSFLEVAITNALGAQMWAVKAAVEDIRFRDTGGETPVASTPMKEGEPYQPKLPLEN